MKYAIVLHWRSGVFQFISRPRDRPIGRSDVGANSRSHARRDGVAGRKTLRHQVSGEEGYIAGMSVVGGGDERAGGGRRGAAEAGGGAARARARLRARARPRLRPRARARAAPAAGRPRAAPLTGQPGLYAVELPLCGVTFCDERIESISFLVRGIVGEAMFN